MREELREKLELIQSSQNVIGELHFLLEDDGELLLRKGDVEGTTQIALSDDFMTAAIQYFSNEELEIKNLTEVDDRNNVLYRYDYETPIREFELIKQVQTTEGYEAYNFKHDDISALKGYLMTYIHEDFRVTLYKQHYPFFLLKQDKNILLRFTGQNRLDEVKGDVFRLNNSFDFIIFDDILYIKELEKLERHYQFHEAIRRQALNGIDMIRGLDIIEDTEELESMIQDVTFARKIIKVTTGSPVLKEVGKDGILSFVRTFNNGYLLDMVQLNDLGNALTLTTKKSKQVFLKILNDDYLFSQLTQHLYASVAKDKVQESVS